MLHEFRRSIQILIQKMQLRDRLSRYQYYLLQMMTCLLNLNQQLHIHNPNDSIKYYQQHCSSPGTKQQHLTPTKTIDSAKERPMFIVALDRPQVGCHAFYLELLRRINTNAVAADAAIAVDATDKSNVVLLLRWANRTPSWKATSLLMVCSTRCMDPLMSDRSLQQAHRCCTRVSTHVPQLHQMGA
jgi:hypothetical protein